MGLCALLAAWSLIGIKPIIPRNKDFYPTVLLSASIRLVVSNRPILTITNRTKPRRIQRFFSS